MIAETRFSRSERSTIPKLTLTIEGFYNIQRFAEDLQRGRCEQANLGFDIERKAKNYAARMRRSQVKSRE